MTFDWSTLRNPAPSGLVEAREAAHHAAQALTRAARANLAPAPDDSHSALLWSPSGLLVTQPLGKGVTLGLDVATLALVFYHREKRERGEGLDWLDARLAAVGLKPASGAKLPYELPEKPPRKTPELAALARWLAAASDVLEDVRTKYSAFKPTPAYLWPHHFDIATLLTLDKERSIGVGVSMGDHFYAQPYAYISPYPAPKDPPIGKLAPSLPAGGHWHTKDFFGAVATAEELLAQRDPRAALMHVIEAAIKTFL